MGWRDLGVAVVVGALAGAMSLVSLGCSPLGKPIDPEVSPSYFYGKGGQGVIFCSQGNWLKLGHTRLEGADRGTFRPLSASVAVDQHRVYYRAIPQPHVDVETFQVEGRVWRDEGSVYFTRHGADLWASLGGADVESFRYLFPDDVNPRMWARDAHRYYINHEPIDVDVESFRFLNKGFVADRYQIYQRDSRLRSVSAVSGPIEVLNDYHLRMGTRVLSGGFAGPRVLDFEEIRELRVISELVVVINDRVYSKGELVPEEVVDAGSLEAWPGNDIHARDAHNVFFVFRDLEAVEGADRESFEPMEGYGSYARDVHRVYYQGRELAGADLETFEVVRKGDRYVARDKHGEFFMHMRAR